MPARVEADFQRSATFFLELCSFIANSLVDAHLGLRNQGQVTEDVTVMPKSKSLWLGTLVLSNLFMEYAQNTGFNKFSTVAGLGTIKKFILEQMWKIFMQNVALVLRVARDFHPGVLSTNIQPYIKYDEIPNLISPLHLICQSICFEHVSQPFY